MGSVAARRHVARRSRRWRAFEARAAPFASPGTGVAGPRVGARRAGLGRGRAERPTSPARPPRGLRPERSRGVSRVGGNQVRGVLEFFAREPRPATRRSCAAPVRRARWRTSSPRAARSRSTGAASRRCSTPRPRVVYAKDTKGRYLFVNRRFEQVLECRPPRSWADDSRPDAPEVAALARNDERCSGRARSRSRRRSRTKTASHTYLSVKFPLRDVGGDDLRGVRHLDRRHRAQTRAAGARRARGARACQSRQERLPVPGQPRAAHAAERDPRLRPGAGGRGALGAPAEQRRADHEGRPPPARAGQRPARDLAHRVGRDEGLAGTGGHRAGGTRHRAAGRAAGRGALRLDRAHA